MLRNLPQAKGFSSVHLGGLPMNIASWGDRPINDCFVKKMSNPLLSGSKVPIISATQFITSAIALDETSCAEAGNQALLGYVGGP